MTEVKLVNAIDAHWGSCIREIPIRGSFTARIAMAFSHNGSKLAVVSDKDVKIFETATGASTFEVVESAISIAFSPNDDMLACGFENGPVKVWDVQTRNLVRSFEGHEGRILSVAFSPCGDMIVSGSVDHTVRIWDISLGCCTHKLTDHSNPVSAVCWSGTGDGVISGSEDASVGIWDISGQTCLMIRRGRIKSVTSVASFSGSGDSSQVACGSKDGTVTVYNAKSGDILHTISTKETVYSVRFSIKGDELVYTNWKSATIWDLSRKKEVSTIGNRGSCVILSPDWTRVASESNGFVKIWNTKTRDSNVSYLGQDILFAPDGRVFTSQSSHLRVSTFNTRDIGVWDITSGDCLFTFESRSFYNSIVFSPDSAFIACWSNDFRVRVLNVHTRSLVADVHLDIEGFRSNVALSPCGSRLVSQTSSQIILWDLGNGKRLAHLDLDFPFSRESQIAFAVDGTSVFIHDGVHIQRRWRISSALLLNDHDDHFPSSNQSNSLPLIFIPVQESLSHEVVSVPRQCCHYEGGEWILNEDGKCILWLPSDKRGEAWLSKPHGKTITMGTYPSMRVYVADFSDALL
jgi:WD40 repeat protein